MTDCIEVDGINVNAQWVRDIRGRLDNCDWERQALAEERDSLQSQIDEIRGIAGYPAKDELEKRGLTDSLADIIRCNHQRYMEATHRAEQREIAAQIQVDSMQSKLSEAITLLDDASQFIERMADSIKNYPFELSESTNKMRSYAVRLRQQTNETPDERSCMYDEYDEVE